MPVPRPDPRQIRFSDRVDDAVAARRGHMAIALLDKDGAARTTGAALSALASRWDDADARVRGLAGHPIGGAVRLEFASHGVGTATLYPQIDIEALPSAHARMAVAGILDRLRRDAEATAAEVAHLLRGLGAGLCLACGDDPRGKLSVVAPGVASFHTNHPLGIAAAIAAHRYVQARLPPEAEPLPKWAVAFDRGEDEGGPMCKGILVRAASPADAVRRARRLDRAAAMAAGSLTLFPLHAPWPVAAVAPAS